MPTDFETYPDRGAIRFLRARDFGDVINVTFRFLSANLQPLAMGQLVVAGPALVLVTASLLLFGGAELFNPLGAFSGDPEAVFDSLSPFFVVTIVAYLLAALLSFAAAFGVVLAYRRDELAEVQGAEVWDEARPTLLPLVGVIGLMVGLMVLAVPVLIIPCLGALAFLVAAAYFFPAFYLVYAVRLFEGGGAWAALRRAVGLMRTNWGRAAGTMFVGLVLSYILSLVVSVPGIVLSMGASGDGAAAPVLGAVGSVLQLAALLVSNTFFVVLTTFLHGSLKATSEGTELDADLDRLAAGGELDDPDALGADAPPTRASDPAALERADAPPESPAPSAEPDDTPPSREKPPGGGFRGGGFGA